MKNIQVLHILIPCMYVWKQKYECAKTRTPDWLKILYIQNDYPNPYRVSEKYRFCYKKELINTNSRTKVLSFYTVEPSCKASYNTSQLFCFFKTKHLRYVGKSPYWTSLVLVQKRFTVCIIFFPNNIIPYYHHSAAFKVDYMCSSQLAPGSRDLSQAERGITVRDHPFKTSACSREGGVPYCQRLPMLGG